MTRISQLIAVVVGVKADTDQRMAKLKQFAGDSNLFKGHERSYEPLIDGATPEPPESMKVRVKADDILEMARTVLARQWDVVRTLDEANAGAYCNVQVGGEALLEHVPVQHVNWLSRELDRLEDLVSALPVPDQSKEWEPAGQGLVRNGPVVSLKTEKVPTPFVLYDATQYQPAQVERVDQDKVIGTRTTMNYSGAISPERRQQLLDRIRQLRDALKMAREDANASQVEDKKEGKVLLDWVLRA